MVYKKTAVDKAEQALQDAKGSLQLAQTDYRQAKESLESGLDTVSVEHLRALADQQDYFRLRVVGAEKNLADARKAELEASQAALADEIDAYTSDTASPLVQARKALEDAQEALQRFTEATDAHNTAYSDFKARAAALGAAYESGPARAQTAIALKGTERFGVQGVFTDRYSLHSIDAKRILDALHSGKLANNPIANPERPEPNRAHKYFRNSEGHSVSYEPEFAPDPIYQKTRGLTRLDGEEIWPGWIATEEVEQ